MAKGTKTGGRKVGTPNKITRELRERISIFLSDNWEQMEADFKKLEPRERHIFYERLLSYGGVPKLQSMALTAPDHEKIVISFKEAQ
jgi:hypothetical protein